MDEQLAAIYGTGNNEVEETDIEKMAAAELLVKLAEEEGVDLDQFNDQEIAEMVSGLYKGAEFPPKKDEGKKEEHEEEESPKKEKEEEAKEKAAEADFLGRVMAHSMVQEIREIEKEAGKVGDALKAVKDLPGRYGKNVKERAQSAAASMRQAKAGRSISGQELTGGQRILSALRGAKKLAPEAGVAAALTGGGILAAKSGKKKESSANMEALDQLASQRAFEMAKEAGYIDDEGNFLVEQQKEASALELAIEKRALEICEANGIPVEWNE